MPIRPVRYAVPDSPLERFRRMFEASFRRLDTLLNELKNRNAGRQP